ncbi:gamma-glutamylcyclotransferase [Ponticoccus sp. SC2-23]|uniref:gamma-glutamylcyclotransferase n=1 Tax=Alexandriicola marinus TaxID=2081710 RepID=UPI000FD8E3ED|nr:gamma-glutamylcyclotransferase [Alexandriicola marinus]MBM1222260.1 gamma-glutamylcyclotransferase [Ponticoccus sp. SC6-9]MBM1224373.1 gamma-glutamylcyclotransferase [Ponticoccus sp. SC6-15]MBM1229847.1 gamma-glutamylcyclotransferase [Ponticoccus sp. SC6-38]MBM1233339.1 gamma-glutamylcyclotransferase [Ponticoccus sp. SC6-45]MBM1236711.1 gamma-glutamylcyclotransferase [Ponticoccus sp. SC6-49]MBM1244755.1 gamma-glutamylcyclotransferase [Ponticoccus sp. SC2-64]MBM1246863.1 gamma-glutamylcycl
MTNLFLYGTLRHGPLRAVVAGETAPEPVDARLADHAVAREPELHLPFLVRRPGVVIDGLLLRDVGREAMARLDAYEGDYRRAPVEVHTDQGPVQAEAYFPPDHFVEHPEPWSFDRWCAESGAMTVLAAEEVFAHDPPLAGGVLNGQWPMILMRADARLRAASHEAPARLRHAPSAGDVRWQRRAPLAGDFFKLDRLEIDHLQFNGTRSGPLPREVLVGADAALVLPYDPLRDRVLLVEQMRAGPARRGDPNPWSLEPVAGIIDAGETPEQSARREGMEEAHVTFSEVRHMFSIYASPGSTTDHFFCFAGLCDLPDDHARHGGLDSEGEDLRLHLVPLDDAVALIETGEVNVGPIVAMLLWLARARDRLEFAPRGT